MHFSALILLALISSLLSAADDPPLAASPSFLRIDLGNGQVANPTIDLLALSGGTLLAMETECRCVTLVEMTPLSMSPGRTRLHLRVVGILPGTKTVRFRATMGTTTTHVQVAVPGANSSAQLVEEIAMRCRKEALLPLVIIHDLSGRLTNCGCSTGSLGGIDHLAALPATLRAAGIVQARCALTGNIDGAHPGLSNALAQHEWEVAPGDLGIATPATLDAALARPDLTIVIPSSTADATPSHAKIVRPPLDGGAAAVVVLRDAATGRIVDQTILPIDGSLPSDPHMGGRFMEKASIQTRPASDSERTACASCHATAHQTWLTTAHARAFSSLKPQQRVDVCISCHSTESEKSLPTPPSTKQQAIAARVEHVTCIACHQGAEAHAQAPTTTRTLGAVDCRTCHDAQHHPAFDPIAAWLRIQHGR